MKNSLFKFILSPILVLVIFIFSCRNFDNHHQITFEITNSLDFERSEIVGISIDKLSSILEETSHENIRIKKTDSDVYLVTQWIDNDGDQLDDEILFPAHLEPNQKKNFQIIIDSLGQKPVNNVVAYSRFVPERTDDYTWENDKVAFRTYGPEAQKRAEENQPGGTLSSGIDLWLKRVEYSVIDQWYANNLKSPGYYHTDHGEGYDPYHVGISRGTGGTGIWKEDSLITSKNFSSYKTIATGPLRTVFELYYAPWGPYHIEEKKRITLDLGSNFSKFENSLDAKTPINNYAIGITLHDNKGEIVTNQESGWFLHWEPIDETHVGQGIVMNSQHIQDVVESRTDIPDQSHLLVLTNPNLQKITFYAGFAWTKSGQVSNQADWEELVRQKVKKINEPLEIVFQ
ncbi:MAG: DUF4861 family protein [Flavobacteriaceae bacterium]|nr:DUF4861 family protein [Flavobacteriaceae bacterium]MCY4253390.1 DUF4861 family protein [Flavobacteriaceae bacterium]